MSNPACAVWRGVKETAVTATQSRRLRHFFGLTESSADGCRLYLPTFGGPARLETDSALALRYGGHTYADRDAKAAACVSAVVSQAVGWDAIEWQQLTEFDPERPGLLFLFGSRSNAAAEWATSDTGLGKFCRFEFGAEWAIRGADDRVFSLPAPDRLSREEYARQTDYGVIGRFQHRTRSVFLIAGLGGRATEGCAYHLAHRWSQLARRFKQEDFVLVLKFPPPIDPANAVEVASYDDPTPAPASRRRSPRGGGRVRRR